MKFRIIRNDIAKNRLITVTTVAFVATAALLVASASTLIASLLGAVDALMAQARTPHFIQMHSGELDRAALADFAAQNGAEALQIQELLNIDGAGILLGDTSLAGSVQDNGFCMQNARFDHLLDLDGTVAYPADGELYLPLMYLKEGAAQVGDTAVVAGVEFRVAGFVRDSQMNSTLASSKRFLVSPNDYAALMGAGNPEVLITFLLKDLSTLNAFETAYTTAGMPANGPTITYPFVRIINAFSDGLMAAVLILVSLLVVAIALLCIRFTLLAKIEDETREIGVMKAIGLRVSDIRRLYLDKYIVLAALGCLVGYALSFLFRGALLENIRLMMGDSGNAGLSLLVGAAGVGLIFLAVVGYVSRVLRRFKTISPAAAIRSGASADAAAKSGGLQLNKNRLLGINLLLGLRDVLTRKRLYLTMLTVLVLSGFIMIVPQNLYSTISDDSFMRYMGVGRCDLFINLQQMEDIPERAREIAAALAQDPVIADHVVLETRSYALRLEDGTEQRIKIDLGDHTVFSLEYAAGHAPTAADEIALSVLNADELGVSPGDTLVLLTSEGERTLTVCGVYSDITNGGKTAKAAFRDAGSPMMWCSISATLTDPALLEETVQRYTEVFDYAKIASVDSYLQQLFGSTVASVGGAARIAVAAALLLALLITLLFLKLLMARDRQSIAILKAVGYTNRDLRAQYLTRTAVVVVLGTLLGALLAGTLGEGLVAALMASFGATSFRFTVNPLVTWLLLPLALAGVTLTATLLGTARIGQISITENIEE